jgi:DMSO/TMAO reductase YedYZ molybdopterin-dependent catalytic subunit
MWSKLFLAGMILMAASLAPGEETPFPSNSLTIFDVEGTRIDISLEELRAMPRAVEEKCICVGESSGYIGIFDYAGVRLSDVLKKAAGAQKASGYKKENMYLVFRGTDQYQVVASWNELTQTAEGRRALVVLEKNGKPLADDEGAIRLYMPGDKFVGRSVKSFNEILIKVVDGVVEHKKEGQG